MSSVPMWWQHLVWFLLGGFVFGQLLLWAQHRRKRRDGTDERWRAAGRGE
jgi:hypothetical protein